MKRGQVDPTPLERARKVRLLILDVDGVLTDGRILLDSNGADVKAFDVRDGFGLVLARKSGLKTAIITAEKSPVVTRRARQLKIDWVAQFARDKDKAFTRALRHFRMRSDQVGYVGDDLLDLPVLTQVGFAATVPDAPAEVQRRVHYVTRARGGRGAVREVVELILRAQGHWERIVNHYVRSRPEA